MRAPGDADRADLLVAARAALLDVLNALDTHRAAVVVVGAQAVYLRTNGARVALAEATKDSDLALDPRRLPDDPRIEEAMAVAGFFHNPRAGQPGAWVNPAGIPVDLMVPEALAGAGGKTARGARIPPHDRRVARRARGLEAAVVDSSAMEIGALTADDDRRYTVRVAGPAALLVSKLHKIGERVGSVNRLNDKDAHDIYRILIDVKTESLAAAFSILLAEELSYPSTVEAIEHLRSLFAGGPQELGAIMAGRAEEGIGEPATVALSVSLLASDLVNAIATGGV
jgi:hypothetical protein